MAIQRKKTCIVCDNQFTTSQIAAKFCGDSCRDKSRSKRQSDKKVKLAKKRVQRIAVNDSWLWVAAEAKRSGTTEILHGHTAETLEQLFELRNYRYRTYGWNNDTRLSKFHLCHIRPANGTDCVGLLHPHNLFVGGSLPNQVHGAKSYSGVGLSIPRCNLKSKWKVSKEDSDKVVITKIEKYLGDVLIEYAKNNPINMSQRLSLAKWVYKNIPNCGFSLKELERKGIQELRKMRADFEEKELYQIDLTAKRSFVVYLDECKRLSEQLPASQHKDNLAWMVPVLHVACAVMSLEHEEGFSSVLSIPFRVEWSILSLNAGVDLSVFRDFISFQAFNALQGAPVDKNLILNTLHKYLSVGDLFPDWSKVPSGCYRYFSEEFDVFPAQVKPLQDAVISLGMVDRFTQYEMLEALEVSKREAEWFESHEWAECLSEHDYSGMYYEVEDDYQPNPNLHTAREAVFVPF